MLDGYSCGVYLTGSFENAGVGMALSVLGVGRQGDNQV
jgi:hypothetical protein